MASSSSSKLDDVEKTAAPTAVAETSGSQTDDYSDKISLRNEVYDSSRVDPILAKKMVLINNAFDEIGMTPWQWKLFVFNGFGYAVDSVSRPSYRTLMYRADDTSYSSFAKLLLSQR
jgi:hypothetical protein